MKSPPKALVAWIAPHSLDDLPSYMALATVAAMSRPECPGHPVKLLNYMLAGTSIVCFAGAAKGLRHMHDAFIALNHDYDSLGKGIVTLLKNRALAAQLGVSAHATVLANFDWRYIYVDVERIYHKLVEAAKRQNGPAASPHACAKAVPDDPLITQSLTEIWAFRPWRQHVQKSGGATIVENMDIHTQPINEQPDLWCNDDPIVQARQPLYAQHR